MTHPITCAALRLAPTTLLLAGLWAGSAHAADPDTAGLVLNVGASFVNDSNLFRLPNSAGLAANVSKSDTVRQLGLGAKAALETSLQRWSLEAGVQDNHYLSNAYLDNASYNAATRLDWRLGDGLNGNLRYGYRRALASFADQQRLSRDLLTEHGPALAANWRLGPDYVLGAELARQDSMHSDASQRSLDNQIDSATVSFVYTTGSNSSVGTQLRQSWASYRLPQIILGTAGNNDYRQTDLGLVANWQLTGLTRVVGELGFSSRKQQGGSSRDFSGITGRGSLDWSPSAKTMVRVGLGRQLAATSESSAAYVLLNEMTVRPSWQASETLSLEGLLAFEKSRFKGDAVLLASNGGSRLDQSRRLRLQAQYQPIKSTQLLLGFEAGSRSSNAVQRSYAYRQIEASAKFSY